MNWNKPTICITIYNNILGNMKSKNNFFIDQEKIRAIDTFRIIYFVTFLIPLGLQNLVGIIPTIYLRK